MNSKGQKLVAPASMPIAKYYNVGNCLVEYIIETHDEDGGAPFFHEIALCSTKSDWDHVWESNKWHFCRSTRLKAKYSFRQKTIVLANR